jgi:hypothetical protein
MKILHKCTECQRLDLTIVQAYRFTREERLLVLEALEERIRSLQEAESSPVYNIERFEGSFASIEKKSKAYKIYRRLGGNRPLRDLIRCIVVKVG